WGTDTLDFEVTNIPVYPAGDHCVKVILAGPGEATCDFIAQTTPSAGYHAPIVEVPLTDESPVTLDLRDYLFDREYMVYTFIPSSSDYNKLTLTGTADLLSYDDQVTLYVGGCTTETAIPSGDLGHELPTQTEYSISEDYTVSVDEVGIC
ncbi:hypothetical protein KIPB_014861, partial [Kipferlia bialata]